MIGANIQTLLGIVNIFQTASPSHSPGLCGRVRLHPGVSNVDPWSSLNGQQSNANANLFKDGLPQAFCHQGRQRVVHQELHGTVTNGSSRSRTVSAGYCRASRMSSRSRSGNALRISSLVMPSATIPTTVATGMRSPRMQGMPSIWLGLTVTRVNFI